MKPKRWQPAYRLPRPTSPLLQDETSDAARRKVKQQPQTFYAYSKKGENHRHALALYFMYYNFACIHSNLQITPAMVANVSDHVWSLEEIVGLL